jgi:hypothetical protein
MRNGRQLKAGMKKAWARAHIIAKVMGVPIMAARTHYAKLNTEVKNNDNFWQEVAAGHEPPTERLRYLLNLETPNMPGNGKTETATIPQEPIRRKTEKPETIFRQLVLDLGTVRSMEIIEQMTDAVMSAK